MRVWGAVVAVVGFAAGEFALSAETAPRQAFAASPLDLRLRAGAKGKAPTSHRQRGGACELACHGVRPPPAWAPLPCAAARLRSCASGPCLKLGGPTRAHAGPSGFQALLRAFMRPDCTRADARAPSYAAVRPSAQPSRRKTVCETEVQKAYSLCPRGRPPAGRQGNHEEQAVCPGNVAS
jgi:hypothetical protein